MQELLQLWNGNGVCTWDEHGQEEFNLKALLFVTINDWPALSNLSGQTNRGYHACTHCLADIESIYIPGKLQEECVPGPSSISSDQPSMLKERQAFQRLGRSPEEARHA